MKIEALPQDKLEEFISYCKKYRNELDITFLYDESLKEFMPNLENPSYIATDKQGRMVACSSLILDEYYRREKKGRFRILHSENDDEHCYKMLLQETLKHIKETDIEKLNLFIPTTNEKYIHSIENICFTPERFTFLLLRDLTDDPRFKLPEKYVFMPFRPGVDESAWCKVRNASFATLKGHETAVTTQIVAKMTADSDYVEGGMKLLYDKDQPVGIVRGALDEYNGENLINIGPLANIPEYQGRGLGRVLLRAFLKYVKNETPFKRVILSVNAENDRAKTLYLHEGFEQVEAVTCYKFEC